MFALRLSARPLLASVLALAIAIVGSTAVGAQTLPPQAPPMTLDQLRQGGYVIFFRHVTADDGVDGLQVDLTDCTTQRNIREAGLRDARLIGQAFRQLGIPVGQVFSSEFCRARETAMIAFGRTDSVSGLNLCCGDGRLLTEEQRTAALVQFLSTPPAPNTNVVLVGHGTGMMADLGMGEAAIYRPDGRGGFERVARIVPASWWEFFGLPTPAPRQP
jgi:phosphohistidine phosphatase SixA